MMLSGAAEAAAAFDLLRMAGLPFKAVILEKGDLTKTPKGKLPWIIDTDGTAWTLVGTATLTISGPVYAGLAVTSHSTASTATATFTGVRVQ